MFFGVFSELSRFELQTLRVHVRRGGRERLVQAQKSLSRLPAARFLLPHARVDVEIPAARFMGTSTILPDNINRFDAWSHSLTNECRPSKVTRH